MRRTFLVVAVVAVVGIAFGSILTSAQRDDFDDDDVTPKAASGKLEFEYQFGVVDSNGREKYVAQMPPMRSGDRFVVRMRSARATYAYLFVSDSEGGYTLLAPQNDDDDEDRDEVATEIRRQWQMLPDEDATLRLDERDGVERVYVVVSNRPVPEVERLASRGEDVSVDESWLIALREKVASRGKWSRQQSGASVRSAYSDANGRAAVAVEDVAFRHQ